MEIKQAMANGKGPQSLAQANFRVNMSSNFNGQNRLVINGDQGVTPS
jgi:hypothetical protein